MVETKFFILQAVADAHSAAVSFSTRMTKPHLHSVRGSCFIHDRLVLGTIKRSV
jgi:hypothetical protein